MPMDRPTVVLVHGMFMNSACWAGWIPRLEGRGFSVMAPSWPGRDGPVEVVRARHPDPTLPRLGFDAIVARYADRVRALPEPPIIIGHSMGGLVTQVLLSRGLGAAGVVLDSAPPRGVLTYQYSFLRSNWPVLSPFYSSDHPYAMSFRRFQYAFANATDRESQRRAYDSYIVPESLRVPRESVSRGSAIDFTCRHAPLLFIAGGRDHIIPPGLNRKNHARWRAGSASPVEFREFPGRDHFGIVAGDGWEEVAEYAADWATGAMRAAETSADSPVRSV